jgi:hypothetical protein
MAWTQPITNRTILDIDKLQEYDEIGYKNLTNDQKAEWIIGMKGALNASDLNRIESNQQYILSLLSTQYTLTFKTDWLMTDFVEDSDENRILSNLKTLMQPFDFVEEPQVPDKPLNYFEKINQIENIILQMYDKYNERGESIRGGFHTDQNESFMTSDNEDLNVFTQQI